MSQTRITGKRTSALDRVLTPDALQFVERLHQEFGARRVELLQRRADRSKALRDGTETLAFATSGPALDECKCFRSVAQRFRASRARRP